MKQNKRLIWSWLIINENKGVKSRMRNWTKIFRGRVITATSLDLWRQMKWKSNLILCFKCSIKGNDAWQIPTITKYGHSMSLNETGRLNPQKTADCCLAKNWAKHYHRRQVLEARLRWSRKTHCVQDTI